MAAGDWVYVQLRRTRGEQEGKRQHTAPDVCRGGGWAKMSGISFCCLLLLPHLNYCPASEGENNYIFPFFHERRRRLTTEHQALINGPGRE